MKSITSANSVLMLSIAGLYPIPQQLQGFACRFEHHVAGFTVRDGVVCAAYDIANPAKFSAVPMLDHTEPERK